MPNAYIERERVHTWSEEIGSDASHQAVIGRLLKNQRRISRFVEENAGSMQGMTGGVAMYLVGVIARIFDLQGGRLKSATWADVRDAEARIGEVAGSLLPLDDGLLERARAVSWRAQPHILDEALMSLFERTPDEGEEDLDKAEAFKVYLLMWVATEVLDSNWKPAKGFEGESDYTYVHIEPSSSES